MAPPRPLGPIALPTVGCRDWLLDSVAAARELGLTASGFQWQQYHGENLPKPLEDGEAATLLSNNDLMRRSLNELLERAGRKGNQIRMWRQSDLNAYRLLRDAERAR